MRRLPADRGSADERGVAAIEYALLVALIAVVILSSVAALGMGLRNSFRDSCRDIAAATRTTGSC